MAPSTTQLTNQATGAPHPPSDGKPAFPFLDLKAQYASIREEVMAALAGVMETQQLILGPDVRSFEEEVATYVGARSAVGCASGSDALMLALLAARVGPGDEVITTSFTFVATAGSIARVGAKPIFVDIDPENFNIDPRLISKALTRRTRAVIPVHLFGLSADLDPILKVAGEHNLTVIEDAAQAIGAEYKGRRVGSQGTFGCFSFFPSKNLGGAGDGGMVTTNDPLLAERLRILRVHGSKRKYYYESLGTNSRLDTLQAAVLRVKLPHLKEWAQGRQRNADNYRALFAEYGLESRIKLPATPAHCFHVYNQFVIRCTERDRLREFLTKQGLPSEVYYPLPLHLQSAFAYLGYQEGQLPESEAASREVLALPVYPELKPEQQCSLVSAIAEFYRNSN